ncbi:MAG: VOC family protein [Pseudomonadota bacterium]
MARVTGLGGVFFRSKDPKALGEWYAKHLGLDIQASFGGSVFMPDAFPAGGYNIWTPFAADTTYFGDSGQSYMVNLMVDDLDGALEQVAAGGATLEGEPERSEFGAFGWFIDPDGNKIELWQPPAPDNA